MDKGGLVPDHCQVVPVEHAPSFAAMPVSAAEEVWLYIQSVRKCLAAGGGGAPLENREPRDLVVFERHLSLRSKGGNHCHMNCVPVPRERAENGEVIFEQAAKRLNFEWTELSPKLASALDLQTAIAEIAVADGEYYAVHLPDGAVLMRCIRPKEPHWMSFGREVLGHHPGVPQAHDLRQVRGESQAAGPRAEVQGVLRPTTRGLMLAAEAGTANVATFFFSERNGSICGDSTNHPERRQLVTRTSRDGAATPCCWPRDRRKPLCPGPSFVDTAR